MARPAGIAELWPRQDKSPTKNVLTLNVIGLRRAFIAMKTSIDTRGVRQTVRWSANVFGTLATPSDLAPSGGTNITLAPSVVPIPELGAQYMLVLTCYWPAQPTIKSLSVFFTAGTVVPAGRTFVWGWADTVPHNFNGVFLTPSGPGGTPLLARGEDPWRDTAQERESTEPGTVQEIAERAVLVTERPRQ
jgi:hypothetical protein